VRPWRRGQNPVDFLYGVSIAAIGDHVDEVEGPYPELVESGDDPEGLRHARIGRDESRNVPNEPVERHDDVRSHYRSLAVVPCRWAQWTRERRLRRAVRDRRASGAVDLAHDQAFLVTDERDLRLADDVGEDGDAASSRQAFVLEVLVDLDRDLLRLRTDARSDPRKTLCPPGFYRCPGRPSSPRA
jgi:hypothetical protein